jgi:hypothetical protein
LLKNKKIINKAKCGASETRIQNSGFKAAQIV